ncbi:hypothetical protein DD237_003793 [Peronospora effusa]|uniref:BAR domain-containing protein n=1 Tax=Peronospora effusa TaxID=542832 RepID=A0A3R7XJW7_9STRA|nr:hypothetical protein DD237_003793 [Peronospora effusa]
MVFATRANGKAAKEEVKQDEEGGTDSCPVLGEDEMPISDVQSHRIRDVRRIDNGVLIPKRSLAQRIRSYKNRFVQRALVACHLADLSKDLMFKQEQTSNIVTIERLRTIRSSLVAHSQSIVRLSTAICCFTGNSARVHEDAHKAQVDVAKEGYRIHEYSLVFSDQVEETILTKIDNRLAELESIHFLIEERAKLVLDVEYAKRTLAVEQQKGNINSIADRKQAVRLNHDVMHFMSSNSTLLQQLEHAQLECERATRSITEQLKSDRPNQDTDVSKLFQEYTRLVAEFFERGVDLLDGAK